MKIVVVGLGYVGLSNAVLLAQNNEVIGVDISQQRVDAVNARVSPIGDKELSVFLTEKDLNLTASTDLNGSIDGADYVILATPTNYDPTTNYFDTSSLISVLEQIVKNAPTATTVIKSTIPVGFIDNVRQRLDTEMVIFSPEFLREGRALHDNLYPSRIIVGSHSKSARKFASLLAQGALKKNIDLLFTGTREAEAIKLFSNSYLAMRVAFFNEVDTYALANNMEARQIIDGVSLDPRIGKHYNNPSFGYGGYCLPKDTKQLLANYEGIPQEIISAIVASNSTRKDVLVDKIISYAPDQVGIYRLAMKEGSDNFRESSVLDLIKGLVANDIRVVIYEPDLSCSNLAGVTVNNDFVEFKLKSSLIVANRISVELSDVLHKVFSRDLYNEN